MCLCCVSLLRDGWMWCEQITRSTTLDFIACSLWLSVFIAVEFRFRTWISHSWCLVLLQNGTVDEVKKIVTILNEAEVPSEDVVGELCISIALPFLLLLLILRFFLWGGNHFWELPRCCSYCKDSSYVLCTCLSTLIIPFCLFRNWYES